MLLIFHSGSRLGERTSKKAPVEREWGGNSEKKKGQTLRNISVSLFRIGGSTQEGRHICIHNS